MEIGDLNWSEGLDSEFQDIFSISFTKFIRLGELSELTQIVDPL